MSPELTDASQMLQNLSDSLYFKILSKFGKLYKGIDPLNVTIGIWRTNASHQQ